MSAAGTPEVGDSPAFSIKSGITEILFGSVMYLSGIMESAPCDGSNRDMVLGVAKQEYPLESDTAGIAYVSESTDVGPNSYDALNKISVEMEGVHWALVDIPGGGSNITIEVGSELVPCKQSGSLGCEKYVRNASYTDPPSKAELEVEMDERRRIFAVALSNIHAEHRTGSGKPGLGINNADLLSADTPRVLGWVLVKLLK